MEISHFKGEKVKISKNSITCKGENGKTKGVVRDVTPFKYLQPNKQINFTKQLRESGLWGSSDGDMDRVVYKDNALYYLFDIGKVEHYNKYYANLEGFESEKARHLNRIKQRENAVKSGITVIDCYVI